MRNPQPHLHRYDDGISKYAIRRLRERGLIDWVHPNVYRLTSATVTWKGRLMAAVLAAGPGAVASHAWALKLHGIDRIVTVDGIPATSGARTAVDLAGTLSEADLMAVVDDVICRRKSTRRWMHRRACHLQHGRPGVGVIVRITAPGAEKDFWSWLERRFDRDVVTRFGLPTPVYNVPVHDDRGRIGYADASWEPGWAVVVELDGLRFHTLSRQRRRDARQHNRYATSGRIPMRFS